METKTCSKCGRSVPIDSLIALGPGNYVCSSCSQSSYGHTDDVPQSLFVESDGIQSNF